MASGVKALGTKLGLLLGLMVAAPLAGAQTLPAPATVLHSMTAATDGSTSRGSVILASDGNFYGVTFLGGSTGGGTLYKITPSGTFTVVYTFPTSDANGPFANVVEAADGNLYGTLYSGGTAAIQGGGIFRYSLATGAVTILYEFQTGGFPEGDLVDDGNGLLYGTAAADGVNGAGSVWTWNYKTNSFTTLYSFSDSGCYLPGGGVVIAADGKLYGNSSSGGADFAGCVWVMNTDGTGYTDVYDFTEGNDGGGPNSSLAQASDGNLYGFNQFGNAYNNFGGVVYQVTPKGATSTVQTFYGFMDSGDGYTPKQGRPLIGGDGKIYVAARFGGANGFGQVMQFDLTGKKKTVFDFGPTSTGPASPYGQVVEGPDGSLYGATNVGGANKNGSVYKLAANITPAMTLTPSLTTVTPNTPITLTWSVNNAFSNSARVCIARSSDGSWTGSVATSGAATVTPTDTTTDYALTCGGYESVTTSVAVSGIALAIKPATFATAYQGTSYATSVSASGGKAPYTWSVSGGAGNLPSGLTLNATTGVISGTPTAQGTFNFTIVVTDSQSDTASAAFQIVVRMPPPVITSLSLPAGALGLPYSTTLIASGGVPPYKWTVTGGALPAGLTLSSTGVISGTPMAQVSGLFTAQAADSQSSPEVGTASLSISIGLPTVPVVAVSFTPLAANPNQAVTFMGSVIYPFLIDIAPTGTIQFKVNGVNAGSPLTLNSTGAVTLPNQIFTTVGTYTVTAVYSGDNLYASGTSLATPLIISNPTITVAPSPISVLSIGSTTAAVTMKYFQSSSFTLACSNLPARATCSFGPVSPDGVSVLTITTGVATASLTLPERGSNHILFAGGFGMLLLGLAGGFRKKSWRIAQVLVLLALTFGGLMVSGCTSGGGRTSPSTPTGTTSFTVTATAGSQTATTTTQMVVN